MPNAILKKRILIITADVGFGHRSAANAVASALSECYSEDCLVEIVNPLDDKRTPALLRDTQTDYDRLVRLMPESYKVSYQISNEPVPNVIVEQTLTILLFNVLIEMLKQARPDVVIVTNPIYLAPLKSVLAIHKLSIPYLTVITDLTQVHRQWFNNGADAFFVPTSEVYQQALQFDIPVERVHLTGIPVNTAISREARTKEGIRNVLDWEIGKIILLIVGSRRVRNLDKVINIVNHSGLNLQMAIVAGGDDDFFSRMSQVEWHTKTYLYNFVERMPDFMHAADCIISKAGGLIVSEALACGLPFLFVDVTPGQEEGNAQYVIRNNAGVLAKNPIHALETLCHWLEHDNTQLQQYADASLNLGRPQAAYEIAELTIQAAKQGRINRPFMSTRALTKLREALTNFGILWEDEHNSHDSRLFD
jgi:1,2-diacylglycerol 3-beta-galactosyltransferase